ncbi:MAG TPA: alkaline phosphatase family protein [Bryobacteraceae bacterium]|nr:alkaline phosphatase family protein [Bryobacteraceae bacterium]
MKKKFGVHMLLLGLACLALAALPATAGAVPKKPKLVVAIVIDQFRYDYLTRFESEYTGGFHRLLTQGAVFSNANYEHFPTVTAIGHSTFLTGAIPALSGIVGNDWYDRTIGKSVTSVSDPAERILGGAGEGGASPRRLLVSTVGDELKIADRGKSRVIGVSLKDRAAILPSGHMADGAYWFDSKSGHFVSSSYYFSDLPAWVKDFNGGHPADKYRGRTWLGHKLADEASDALYGKLAPTPFGNELVEAFAERALSAEQLGRHEFPDILTVSFSSNDYVGHAYGPDSPEAHDISLQTDRLFDKFFHYLDSQVGLQNVLIVMTADHGAAPVPEVNVARKMPGGRLPARFITDPVQAALTAKYGEGKWIVSPSEHSLYFNLDLIRERKLDRGEVERTAAAAILQIPHVFRVYTREQLLTGMAMADQVGRRVANGYYASRGADIYILMEPYWLPGKSGTTHGTAFSYDAHVPVIFMGSGIRAGRYFGKAAPNDIAPTLAAILSVETPSGSVGRVLDEMFAD